LLASADEAGDPEERTAVDDAKEFLQGLLADGPVSTKAIRGDAEGAGHAWATLRRARKSLGVEATKDGMKGGWVWKLRPKVLKKSEDAQQNNVSTFGDDEHLRDATAKDYRKASKGE
jgi:putative DNA primase/helicase